MVHYCTSFNEGYLSRGLALYQSLEEHSTQPITLWVLCFDERVFEILSQLQKPNLKPVALSTLEADDPALLIAKQNRSRVEFFFTTSPIWPLYLLKHHPDIDQITYLDADLFFFSDPQPIFDEMGSASILIIPHRFSAVQKQHTIYGIYNVGLLSFRNDQNALECLHWWRERCLEWCYDRVEEGKFADQKYLDDWPTRFKGVHVLEHQGANLAPWNVANYHVQKRGNVIYVDEKPLIFFHFQGLKLINRLVYDPGVFEYGIADASVKYLLYPRYVRALRLAWRWAKTRVPDLKPHFSGLNARYYNLRTFFSRLRHGHIMFARLD